MGGRVFRSNIRVRLLPPKYVTSKIDFTRENLYCLVAIAFFIWRSQCDIRHVTTSPLTVSESSSISLVD